MAPAREEGGPPSSIGAVYSVRRLNKTSSVCERRTPPILPPNACAACLRQETVRHSCATHLFAEGYETRTVQELFGHKGVHTTMVYTPVLHRGGCGVRSRVDQLAVAHCMTLKVCPSQAFYCIMSHVLRPVPCHFIGENIPQCFAETILVRHTLLRRAGDYVSYGETFAGSFRRPT
jgi:Phage integrase family